MPIDNLFNDDELELIIKSAFVHLSDPSKVRTHHFLQGYLNSDGKNWLDSYTNDAAKDFFSRMTTNTVTELPEGGTVTTTTTVDTDKTATSSAKSDTDFPAPRNMSGKCAMPECKSQLSKKNKITFSFPGSADMKDYEPWIKSGLAAYVGKVVCKDCSKVLSARAMAIQDQFKKETKATMSDTERKNWKTELANLIKKREALQNTINSLNASIKAMSGNDALKDSCSSLSEKLTATGIEFGELANQIKEIETLLA